MNKLQMCTTFLSTKYPDKLETQKYTESILADSNTSKTTRKLTLDAILQILEHC